VSLAWRTYRVTPPDNFISNRTTISSTFEIMHGPMISARTGV
jgi:hypothetical protein